MSNYYFVGSLLPDIKIGQPVEMSFKEFDRLLKLNLSNHDYAKTVILRRFWDIENIRAYVKRDQLDMRGNFDEKELQDIFIETEEQPGYLRDFLTKHETDSARLTFFPELLSFYFREEEKQSTGFLKELLQFQRQLKLILVAFRAKKLGRNLEQEFQFESFEDPFIIQLLTFKDAPHLELPEKYEALKKIFKEYSDNPLALHQAICEYVFAEIDQMVGLDPFTLDRILGYLIQLSLAEKWMELDVAKGVEIVDRFVKEKA